MQDGVETLEMDIDDLFKDPEDSQPQKTSNEPGAKPEEQMTEAVTKRINEVRAKTEKETKDKIAKELGFENYEAMQKANKDKLIKDNGLNPEDVNKIIDPLVESAIANDPRIKKLAEYEEREKAKYISEQLAAINKTTGQKLTVKDLSPEVLDLWGKGIDLEQAYYAVNGKNILSGRTSKDEQGSLEHLAPGSNAKKGKVRLLTDTEKEMYRAIIPGITEEELAKKTIEM